MSQHVDDKEHPSHPDNPFLEHIFTFLTSWKEIETYMLNKMDEIDQLYPPTKLPSISKGNVYARNKLSKHYHSKRENEEQNIQKVEQDIREEGSREEEENIMEDDDETTQDNAEDKGVPSNVVEGVLNGLQERLNYSIFDRLNRQATMNTLSYLYHHMRCGIYVMIRQGKVSIYIY